MSFGQKVRRSSKEKILEISTEHLIQHIQAFCLAGGLIARDEVIVADYFMLPTHIKVKLRKVLHKNEESEKLR